MEYRILSKTDLRVSRLSFGPMTFGSQTDEGPALRIVDRCLDAGINFFDTANIYNKGLAESIVGKALKGRRSNAVLATKVRGKMGDGPDESGLSRAAIHKAIDASLRRLQTDYVDIYYLHQPDYDVPIEETLAAMDEVVRAGKVRYPAVSNFAAWQVCEILWIAEKSGIRPPYISQPMYNLLARGIEEEYLPFCKRFGVALVPYNPLAGGLLTGKHARAGRSAELASTGISSISTATGTMTTSQPSKSSDPSPARPGRRWPSWPSNGCSLNPTWIRSSSAHPGSNS